MSALTDPPLIIPNNIRVVARAAVRSQLGRTTR
jgi:hypothetical protein